MNADPQKRSPWQRLRYLRITLAWLCGLTLSVALIIVAINFRDEPLSPQALAWLREPPNAVAPATNAFLAMAAMQVEQEIDSETGRRMLTAIGADPRLLLDEKRLTAFGRLWQIPEIDSRLCSFKSGDPSIIARLASKHVELEEMVKQQGPALKRYYAAIALPDFHEVTAPPALLPLASAGKAACLARIDLALRLLNGETGARENMKNHIAYWTKAFAGSRTLVSLKVSNVLLRTDMAILTDLHKLDFEGRKMLFENVRPFFQTAADASLGEQVMAGEFRFSTQIVEQAKADEWSGNRTWLEKVLSVLFLKPHATANQMQRLMASAVRDEENGEEICDLYRWNNLYNPLGKLMSCFSQPELKPYLTQMSQMQQEFGQFVRTTE